MNIIAQGKELVKQRLGRLVDARVQATLEYVVPQILEFHSSAKEERQSYFDHTKDPLGNVRYYASLKERLTAAGVPVVEVALDLHDFEHWLDSFPQLVDFYRDMGDVHIEKCLEHYLAYRFLNISKADTYIDIAALGSPWADILNRRRVKSYRLDLVYPKGLNGKNIGADAGNTMLPDAFASVLSAQCAYECFMGDADIRFLAEASRILREDGRLGIAPLYLEDHYYVSTSPFCNQRDVLIDSGAKRAWRDDGYKVPFSRHYSPEGFKSRIFSAIPENMTGRVLYFSNIPDIVKRFEGQRIYCYFMFYCEKRHGPTGSA